MKAFDLSRATDKLSRDPRMFKVFLLLSKDYTVSDAAKEVGISKTTVYKWKREFEADFATVANEAGLGFKLFLLLALRQSTENKVQGHPSDHPDELEILANQTKDTESIILTVHGKPLGVFTPIRESEDLESLCVSLSPTFNSIIEKSRQSIKESGAIPHDEFWASVEETR